MLQNVLRSFSGTPVLCPRCLTRFNVRRNDTEPTCTNCGYKVPPYYVQAQYTAPPFFVQVFGWSNHGKTMYLDVLRLMLYEAHRLWPHYQYSPLTREDFELERELRSERAQGLEPQSTNRKDRDQNTVYILNLQHMERWGSRSMVIMDHAGELFENFEGVPAQEVPFLTRTPTTFMIVSLPNMDRGETIDQLLTIYIETMRRYGMDFQRYPRRLVVVLTKADLINKTNFLPNLPRNLEYYLETDDTWERIYSQRALMQPLTALDMAEQLERMGRVSDEIRAWLPSVSGGLGFMRRIDQNGIDVRFTLATATGRDISGSQQNVTLSPRRVLDPFFWALEFQRTPLG